MLCSGTYGKPWSACAPPSAGSVQPARRGLEEVAGARYVLLAAGLLFALTGSRAHAQVRSIASGLRLNVHAGAAQLGSGSDGARGIGPGASLAYGNSRWFTGFVTWDRVPMSDGELEFDLRHLDAGVRVWLRGADASLVPFVLGSYTWRRADYGEIPFLGEPMTVEVHGGGLTFGAGAAYYLSPRLALEGSVKRTGGAMDHVDANGLTIRPDEMGIRDESWRLNVGLSWWIGPRRQ
ncbi:MAG TPA: hypothetical protein VHG09_00195 [Longimicrobiales bacterium]|nr:hypothetical protein [Longimicrobiales bacterium]